MTRLFNDFRRAAVLALALGMAGPAFAQDRGPGFLDNLFNRGEAEQQAPAVSAQSDTVMRLDRIESALRQLTGTIEELQHRNQVLEAQVRELQQRAGIQPAPGAGPVAVPGAPAMPAAPPVAPASAPAMPAQRSDAFDPSRSPNAPGAPRPLGAETVRAPAAPAGQPLDLNTLAGRSQAPAEPAQPPAAVASAQGGLPPPPPRNPSATGAQLATLPPSARPEDEYDLAYGYVLHKDYGLAVQAFRDFLRKYPEDRLVPDAQYWMGDALFRQQQYREAAEAFLAVSTKYEHSGKAPDALLKLGQSLAELHQKEAACATLAQVGRKYPKASAKGAAARELKKLHC